MKKWVRSVRIRDEGDSIIVDAPAKLNLFLEIIGKRKDGYHLLETVMTPITLFDTIRFSLRRKGGVEILCNDKDIPTDGRNTVVKATKSFCDFYGLEEPPLTVDLKKGIPYGAGLGGGSSDAAATILSLYRLLNIRFNRDEAVSIAEKVGADCPFFIYCRPALLSGIGDKVVRFLKLPESVRFLLFVPFIRTDTFLIYKNLLLTEEKKDVKLFIEYIDRSDVKGMEENLFNRLEETVLSTYALLPVVSDIRRIARFVMSGSGSTWFCLIGSDDQEQRLRKQLSSMDGDIFVVAPYSVFLS